MLSKFATVIMNAADGYYIISLTILLTSLVGIAGLIANIKFTLIVKKY